MPSASNSEPAAVPPRALSWVWVPAVVLALGALSTGLLVWTYRIAERQAVQDYPLELAVLGVRAEIAESHLWLEEYLTGDPDLDLAEVWQRLDTAEALLAAMLDGGEVPGLASIEAPLDDPELRARVREVQGTLGEIQQLSHERLQRGRAAGVGSDLDQRYDRLFFRVLEQATGLDRALRERIAAGQRRSRWLLRGILGAWLLVVSLAVAELWYREQRRRKIEAALRRSESQLARSRHLESLGRLAGGIAHDINNHLAVIASSAELMRLKGASGSRWRERLGTIVDVSFRASSLLRRLLAFSRRQPASPRSVQLNSVIDELMPMVTRLLGDGTRLETHLDDELWNVYADPVLLEQVVVNLLVNAREAMPGGGQVQLTTANVELAAPQAAELGLERPGEYVRLAVEDTGVGIAPEIRERIFDPFFSTKDTGESTGLGLATVFGVVRGVGGAIAVSSEPGSGARFEAYLPRAGSLAESAPTGQVGDDTISKPDEKPLGILLVEDRDEVRLATAELIETLGHRVLTADGAREAQRLFEREREAIELVVTDVLMPGGGGPELAARLRAIEPRLKVLFISGYEGGEGPGVSGLGAPILYKPFTSAELRGAIGEALARS